MKNDFFKAHDENGKQALQRLSKIKERAILTSEVFIWLRKRIRDDESSSELFLFTQREGKLGALAEGQLQWDGHIFLFFRRVPKFLSALEQGCQT